MGSRPETDEALVQRMLPTTSPSRAERAQAWAEWQISNGEAALRKFIRSHNTTGEPDDDILQDSLLTAYIEVERGRYQPREGVPFTAYVKGIARNKLHEARRRRCWPSLDELPEDNGAISYHGSAHRQTESDFEQHERQMVLWRGLTALQGQRRLVLEQYLLGDTTDEIAGHLAVSEDVVRQHKCRGLRMLRQQMRIIPGLEGEGMWAGQREVGSPEQFSPVPACPDDLTRSRR